jgi:transposase
MTISKEAEVIEVIHSSKRRKRWVAYEKHQIVQETYQPGMTVSYIARQHGISPLTTFSLA